MKAKTYLIDFLLMLWGIASVYCSYKPNWIDNEELFWYSLPTNDIILLSIIAMLSKGYARYLTVIYIILSTSKLLDENRGMNLNPHYMDYFLLAFFITMLIRRKWIKSSTT